MIHTFTISYELSIKDANTCAYRLNERTQKFKGYRLTNFLDKEKKFGRLIFKVPELAGIQTVTLLKITDRNGSQRFRIYFLIEAEILRTGEDTLDLFFASPEHAKELQIQYAKAIYTLFPEAFNGRPASHLYKFAFADPASYKAEEFINGLDDNGHGGLYSLPYLPLGSVKRVDFTFDNVSSDAVHAKLFTEMVEKSYYDGWKKKVYIGENKNPDSDDKCYDKAYASGSKGFSVYYKYDKMCSKEYNDRANIAQIREDSSNVTRIEMPIKSPNRETIKALTWLKIPDEAITLGPLPYLATEQVCINHLDKEYNGRIGTAYELKWYTRKGLDKRVKRLLKEYALKTGYKPEWEKKFTTHKGNTIIKLTEAISKRGSLEIYIKALKKYQKTKDKKKTPSKKPFLTMKAFTDYKELAMRNGMMLTTIPASRGIIELSASLNLRKYDYSGVTAQAATYMLPYQSVIESVPELESVKDLYDSILEFLYGLYDQYSFSHNAEMETTKLTPEEIADLGLFGL